MISLHSRRLRRRLSAPTSGSARRRARERRLAEKNRTEGERLARERRELQAREKFELQRKARLDLASYEPWGRAGGGAPNPKGTRFSNLRVAGIYPDDELKGIAGHELCRRWSSPRQHRRTLLHLREDPQFFYADILQKTVDNDIRYKQIPQQQQAYKQILDEMVNKSHRSLAEGSRRHLDYKRKMHTLDGPWGKPGPGGTIWRNPRDIGVNFSKSMGWTDNEIFNKLRGEQNRCKRSSFTLPKVKADDDYSKGDDITSKENIKPSSIEKLPDIGKQSAEKKVRSSNDCKEGKDTCGKNSRTKRSPTKSKFIKRLSNGERMTRSVPNDVEENEERKRIENKPTPEATILRITGGIELVPLLARRRRVGARTLHSSDVTRLPEQACQWRDLMDVDYLRELKHQIRVKCERKEESRRDSMESVRRHHETWTSLWGRPGHGAPQLRGRYARSNLAQLLYVPSLANSNN